MTSKLKCFIAAVVVPIFVFTACAPLPPPGTALTPEQRSQAQRDCITQYTVVGGVGGALLGALLGGGSDRGRGAVIGAAAGGALAFAVAWGQCLQQYSDLKSFPVADARQTAQQVGYDPSRGSEIKIQSFSIDPNSLAPGSEMKLNGSYYVMAPEGQKEVKVTETRAVQYLRSGAKRLEGSGLGRWADHFGAGDSPRGRAFRYAQGRPRGPLPCDHEGSGAGQAGSGEPGTHRQEGIEVCRTQELVGLESTNS